MLNEEVGLVTSLWQLLRSLCYFSWLRAPTIRIAAMGSTGMLGKPAKCVSQVSKNPRVKIFVYHQ